MQFNILGSLEVLDGDRRVDLGRRLQRVVMAVLLVDANRVVPVDRLMSDLWGDDPPRQPTEAVHVYISRLRRALQPRRSAGMPGDILVRQPPGYLIRVPPGGLDADRFEAMVDEGSRLLAAGNPASASRTLSDALALWRGPMLAEFSGAAFAQPAATRLDGLRQVAVERRLSSEMALGHHEAVAAGTRRLGRR